MAKKVRATGMIAQLFRHTENFEPLLSHETLLQVTRGWLLWSAIYICSSVFL